MCVVKKYFTPKVTNLSLIVRHSNGVQIFGYLEQSQLPKMNRRSPKYIDMQKTDRNISPKHEKLIESEILDKLIHFATISLILSNF